MERFDLHVLQLHDKTIFASEFKKPALSCLTTHYILSFLPFMMSLKVLNSIQETSIILSDHPLYLVFSSLYVFKVLHSIQETSIILSGHPLYLVFSSLYDVFKVLHSIQETSIILSDNPLYLVFSSLYDVVFIKVYIHHLNFEILVTLRCLLYRE